MADRHEIGLIADTHGLVRPDCAAMLAGVELILHAGDVGGDEVIWELETIAPVQAVYGNTDDRFNPGLRERIRIEVGGVSIHVSHGHELGVPTSEKLLARYDADVIVFGHTHRAVVTRSGTRLAVNPGAAGPRRFNLLPSVGRLVIEDGRADVQILPLKI